MNAKADHPKSRAARHRLLYGWLALVGLMLLTVGGAFVPLGGFNLVLGLSIAALKTAIVAWLYMRVRSAGALAGIALGCGAAALAVLSGLGAVAFANRIVERADMQQPLQLPALRDGMK